MKLTKDSLAGSVHRCAGLTKSKSEKTIETTLEIMKKTLESDEDILISGFGKFLIKDNSKRRCAFAANGNAYIPGVKKIVTFKCSPALVRKLNES